MGVFVSSDWHGCPPEMIKQLLQKANFGADDYLFVLGDILDRGEHGIELIKFIMYEPNITLIRGNHEAMLLSCSFLFEEITEDSLNALSADKMKALHAWKSNGGTPTMNALSKETPDMRQAILEYLSETPLYDTVSVGDKDYFLVHAGLGNPEKREKRRLEEIPADELLWERPYLTTRYSTDFVTILGHTPTHFYGHGYKGRILKTDTWINIDTGAADGLPPCLLRLDDMREFYLEN